MKRILVALLLTSVFFASYAADARDTYYSSGYYVGLNLGDAQSNDEHAFGGSAYIGYNLNPYIGAEIGYNYLPNVQNVNTYAFNLLLVGHYALGEGFSILGKVGPALLQATADPYGLKENGTVISYGAGIDYAFANIGGLHTTWEWYHLNNFEGSQFEIPTRNLYTWGIYYQF